MTPTKLRVLLDTNIYISYLLDPTGTRAPSWVVRAALRETFTLLLSDRLGHELTAVISRKPYLTARIEAMRVAAFVRLLENVAERVSPGQDVRFVVPRDPKDDFVLTAALIGQADYLVTGDADLLVLGQVGPVRIISPAEFAALLSTDSEAD
jgi:putative PIN family toxin of toxin-antitoxin system